MMIARLAWWWWYYHSYCCAASAASLVFVLRFDGSYRANRDETCRAAACAASLKVMSPKTGTIGVQGDNDACWTHRSGISHDTTVCVGGRLLDPRSIESSGQAEYEGIILGLEMLHQCMDELLLVPPPPSMDDDTVRIVSSSRETVPWEIRIEGDCKTVIRQLEGRARPRKLQASYDRARKLLDGIRRQFIPTTIRENFQSHASTSTEGVPSVSFQHIPRHQNVLCDAVAGAIMEWEERCDAHAAVKGLDEIANLCADTEVSVSDEAERRIFPHAKHFCLSQRLALYRALADLSETHGDFRSLHMLGQRLEEELRGGMPTGHVDNDSTRWLWWRNTSVTWQLQGLEGSTDRRHQQKIKKLRRSLHSLSSQLPPGTNHTTVRPAMSPRSSFGDISVDDGRSSPSMMLQHPHRRSVEEWTSRAFVSQEWQTDGRCVVPLGSIHQL